MMHAHRLREGCQMCGASLIDEAANGTWTSKPGQRYVPMDAFTADAPPGTAMAQTINVPVCGECYETLATAEGINKLTQAVNG